MQSTSPSGGFHSTRWTLVLRANASSPEGKVALSDLCEAYYQPVFVFLRRMGFDSDTAGDHAHSFFAHLLERGFPDRGRFRSYLLGAVNYFVGDLLDRAQHEKRGGGEVHESIYESADSSPALLIGDPSIISPAVLFDREWAVAVMNRAVAALAAEHLGKKAAQFEMLRSCLMGDAAASHAETAKVLGMSEGAV